MTIQPEKRIKKYPPTIFVLRDNEIFYKLLLIEKGDDESLYVKFPRKRGYRIKGSHESVDIPAKITFQKKFQGTIFYDPYLSYHAVSGRTHANAFIHQDESNRPKLEIFFHRKDVETIRPFLKDLDKRTIIEVAKVDNTLANLSYSLVLSALPKQPNEDLSLDVVAFLFNKDKVQGFALS